MPQQTGSATFVGIFPPGGTSPVFTFDELPVGTPTTWNIDAINISVEDLTERVPQRNSNGVIIGFIFGETIKRVSVQAKARAAVSGGLAAAVAALKIPSAGSTVTIAGVLAASGNTVFDGSYIIDEGAKIELTDSETEPAKITFTATQYSTAAATLLATVS